METLYERLNQIPHNIKPQVVGALLIPDIAPKYYFYCERIFQKNRDELSSLIAHYLRERGATDIDSRFINNLYYSFTPTKGHKPTKKPLLNIIYGRIGGDHMPDEIFEHLNGWEALYLLAGIWSGRSSGFWGDRFTREHLEAWPIRKIIARTIIDGVEKLQQYERVLGKKLPRKEEVLEACEDALKIQLGLLV